MAEYRQNHFAAGDDLAFVAVADHDYLAVVDPGAGLVVETIDLSPSGCSFPWRVAIPPDGRSVWVSCRYSGTVVVLDRETHEILQAIGELQNPAGIAFTQDSAYALVGSQGHGDVRVFDASTFDQAAIVKTDDYGATIVMHPYKPVAYVAHQFYDGLVSVVDTTTWTVSQRSRVGKTPHHAAISHDGLRLYLANKGNNSVSVVDTVALMTEAEIDIGAMPRELTVSSDDLTLYVTQWGDSEIAIIDTATNTLQQTLDIDSGENFDRPWGMELTCDGSTLITTNSGGWREENRQVALTDTGALTTLLLAMPDQNDDGYPDAGARGLAVCPQFVPQDVFLYPAQQAGRAGRGGEALYPVTLRNFSGMADTYTLTLNGNQWPAVLSSETIGPLGHGESAVVTVAVAVPADADWYATDSVTLTAASSTSPDLYQAAAVMETEAYASPAMTVSPLSLSSTQVVGDVVQKTLEIANGDGVDLQFELGTSFGPGTSFTAASTDLYGYMVSWGYVRVTGISDDTTVQLIDLSNGSIIDEISGLARYESWFTYPDAGTYFKVAASSPVVAVMEDGSHWGYNSFIPSIDAGPVGREFLFYHSQGDASLYVFAIDDATVELRDAGEQLLDFESLNAGEYWQLNPDSGVYHMVANGRVALQLVAENAYTTVPSTKGPAVGQRFYCATDGWGTGAVAVFAYEDARVDLYDLNDGTLLHSTDLSAGEYWWQVELENLQLRLESSGDVEVWAGNAEGGMAIEDLGDDVSFAGGRLGREYYLHSLREGFVIFAPFDNTEITVDQAQYSLGADEYLHFPDCCAAHKITANQPVLVQTLGRDGSWNDMGTYLGGVVAHSGEPVPWLAVDPASGTVPTASTAQIAVTFDAGGVQPGDHAADLIIISNDPALPVLEVPLNMLVEPAADMGRVYGSTSDAWTAESLVATVALEGVHTTLATPTYEIWASEGSYTLNASANGYAPRQFQVTITAGADTELDIALEPNIARLVLEPKALNLTAVEGTTMSTTLTISNAGPALLEVSFHELPSPDSQMSVALAELKNRKILYDRAHEEPQLSDFNTIVDDLAAAGAAVDENFIYPLDAAVLAGYDVLWVNCCGYKEWTFNELLAIKAWLEEGGAILVHGSESLVTRSVAGIYGIEYRSSCSYGTTTRIFEHPITIGVRRVYVDTCSYLTFGGSSELAVKDQDGQPHVVAHEENRGKMVVVAGSDFNDWLINEDDNRLLVQNIFAWLAEPGYEDISWLRSELDSVEIPGHTSKAVTIHVDARNLDVGLYEAILAVEHNDPGHATPAKVPVTLSVGSNPPVANFTAAPTAGASPLHVSFTNLSTGDIDECHWNFGDGSTSTVCADPTHTYGEPGTYTVRLRTKGPGGEDKKTRRDYITVHGPPEASFKASPTSGIPPLRVSFTNLSTGEFTECLWDFGDGKSSTDCADPSHRYGKPGIFTVSLKVKGPGGEDEKIRRRYVTVYSPPTAAFNASPTSGIPPMEVKFTNLSTGDFDKCVWDFGDGGISADCADPTHTYGNPGVYTVSLKVTGLGGRDKVTKSDYITLHGSQTADFSATPTSGPAPLMVNFTNLSTGNFDECLWDFGDGSTSTACTDPSHTYGKPGTFTVSLKVKGPGGEGKLIRTDYIKVYGRPKADFSATPTSGPAPLMVNFTNLSTGYYDSCLWDFGDGTQESACGNVTHKYEHAGHYTVSLTVKGAGGEDRMTIMQCVKVNLYEIFLPKIMRS